VTSRPRRASSLGPQLDPGIRDRQIASLSGFALDEWLARARRVAAELDALNAIRRSPIPLTCRCGAGLGVKTVKASYIYRTVEAAGVALAWLIGRLARNNLILGMIS